MIHCTLTHALCVAVANRHALSTLCRRLQNAVQRNQLQMWWRRQNTDWPGNCAKGNQHRRPKHAHISASQLLQPDPQPVAPQPASRPRPHHLAIAGGLRQRWQQSHHLRVIERCRCACSACNQLAMQPQPNRVPFQLFSQRWLGGILLATPARTLCLVSNQCTSNDCSSATITATTPVRRARSELHCSGPR
jgi:hypothetical protein